MSVSQRKQNKVMKYISNKARARKERWDKIWGFIAIIVWLSFMAGMVMLLLWEQQFFVSFRKSNFIGKFVGKIVKQEEVIPRYKVFFILLTFIYPICASFSKGVVDNKKSLIVVAVVIALGVSVAVTLDFVNVVKNYYAGNVGDYFNAVLQLDSFKNDGFKTAIGNFLAMEGMPEAVKINFYSFCSCATLLLSVPAVISYQKSYNQRTKLFGKKLRVSTLYLSMAIGALFGVALRNAVGLGVSTTSVATKMVRMLRDRIQSKKQEKNAEGMNLEELDEDEFDF